MESVLIVRDKAGIHSISGEYVRPAFVSPTHFIGGFNDSETSKKIKGSIS